MLGHLPHRAIVQRTQLGKFIPQFYNGERVPNIQFTPIDNTADHSGEYVYLSESETVTGVNTLDLPGFIFYTYEPLPSYTESSTVYTTGDDKVHYSG
jgi:hypothetical protein